ncbi:MAG: glycosyl transferase family 2 [Flavobacteriia bacterium]|nr:MAG: glycosyl transferase family 2 [Flavobacteriia bacterium]
MTHSPIKISVIMPVYNVARFLEEAVLSVLNQTLKDLEIILVNDGSTDHSGSICQMLQKRDTRVKYLEQANAGVSIARNNGLKEAGGTYIYFMDSDDTIAKDFLQTSYDSAINNNSDFVVIGDYYCQRMPDAPAFPTCAMLLRHQFLKQYPDVRFPEGIQPCEDGLFSHQLLALTSKVSLNPQGVYHYREHENQNHHKINEQAGKVLRQIPQWFELLHHFYQRYNLFESHARHLALFVEHEPFEFRYLSMPFNSQQKETLHGMIKAFMAEDVLPYLQHKQELSIPFVKFIESSHYTAFDTFYRQYRLTKKIKRFLNKLNPLR